MTNFETSLYKIREFAWFCSRRQRGGYWFAPCAWHLQLKTCQLIGRSGDPFLAVKLAEAHSTGKVIDSVSHQASLRGVTWFHAKNIIGLYFAVKVVPRTWSLAGLSFFSSEWISLRFMNHARVILLIESNRNKKLRLWLRDWANVELAAKIERSHDCNFVDRFFRLLSEFELGSWWQLSWQKEPFLVICNRLVQI